MTTETAVLERALVVMAASVALQTVLLVGLAIAGLITVVLGMAISGLFRTSTRNTAQMNAVNWVGNAATWLGRDAKMAHSVTAGASAGVPLELGWTEWDGAVNLVTYSLVGTTLRRALLIDGVADSDILVSSNVDTDDAMTSASFTAGVLTFKISAQGTGSVVTASRTLQVVPRSAGTG